ncbi:HOOK2 isoform 6 [Pongo abelii]|uniref:HOOK2 isoform 6 n=1 Tax=Pongo abelii TaxID=9601 RepID=A0A2J8RY53_PONAB|nr:HOOK2 isoform 6 [Pongo abelii]
MVLRSLVEYSQDVLAHPVSEEHLPDVSLIGEFSDPAELGKLLQLVLGCAISCEKKQASPTLIPRPHPENHDAGRIGSACGDGSHPGAHDQRHS